jgi:hypothetical protein
MCCWAKAQGPPRGGIAWCRLAANEQTPRASSRGMCLAPVPNTLGAARPPVQDKCPTGMRLALVIASCNIGDGTEVTCSVRASTPRPRKSRTFLRGWHGG